MLRSMPLAVRRAPVLCALLFFVFALIGALAAPARVDGSAAASGNGTVVLAGHRDTHFSLLKKIWPPGDRLVLADREGRRRSFRVVRRDIADAHKNGVRIEPADGLVLVTCYWFDAGDTGGPLRCVVTALPYVPCRAEDGRANLRHALDGRR